MMMTLIVSAIIWGVYNYSEIMNLDHRTEKTFAEVEKDLNALMKEIKSKNQFKI